MLDHDLRLHMYADDIQIYGDCVSSKQVDLSEVFVNCLKPLSCWFVVGCSQISISASLYGLLPFTRSNFSCWIGIARFVLDHIYHQGILGVHLVW